MWIVVKRKMLLTFLKQNVNFNTIHESLTNLNTYELYRRSGRSDLILKIPVEDLLKLNSKIIIKMKRLNIALVAHDARKKELVDWVKFNIHSLYNHHIIATGTTSKLLGNIMVKQVTETDWREKEYFVNKYLDITPVLSGPLGGDQMIGAMIAKGQIDVLIFFCDNLITQGHQTDISALTRLASLYNIAFATNRTTADMILTSSLFANESYQPIKNDFSTYLNRPLYEKS